MIEPFSLWIAARITALNALILDHLTIDELRGDPRVADWLQEIGDLNELVRKREKRCTGAPTNTTKGKDQAQPEGNSG